MSDIGDAVAGHAVLRRPARRLGRPRPQLPRPALQRLKVSALPVVARVVGLAAQDDKVFVGAQREVLLVRAEVHAAGQAGPAKGHAVGARLAHARKIAARAVDKGEVGGKHHLLCPHAVPAHRQRIALHLLHAGIFINLQMPRKACQKLEGVELGLLLKAQRPLGGKGQPRVGLQPGRQPQRPRGLTLLLQPPSVPDGVDIGAARLEVAGDAKAVRQPPVVLHRPLVGHGVLTRRLTAEPARQAGVDEPVLRRDFGGGAARLSAAHAPRLEHRHALPLLLQKPGREKARHPGPDDGRVHLRIALEGLAFWHVHPACPK